MTVTIYHNPACGTSRSTLKLLQAFDYTPTIIPYLQQPPSTPELEALLVQMGMKVQEILREKGTPFASLGLGNPNKTDDQLHAAIQIDPILLNRPVVVTSLGAKLCRPADVVLDLLPRDLPDLNVLREDGTPFLRDRKIDARALPHLTDAMAAAGQPTVDLAAPGRTFFHYTRLDREGVGWGGFELYGADVLLRSMAAERRFHGQGYGRNLAALLMRRAYDQGARQVYAFADNPDVRSFFERLEFVPIDRVAAPTVIQQTGHARGLVPPSATLLTKRIIL